MKCHKILTKSICVFFSSSHSCLFRPLRLLVLWLAHVDDEKIKKRESLSWGQLWSIWHTHAVPSQRCCILCSIISFMFTDNYDYACFPLSVCWFAIDRALLMCDFSIKTVNSRHPQSQQCLWYLIGKTNDVKFTDEWISASQDCDQIQENFLYPP